jgi:predicted DNA-binding transcriptional regulator
MEIKEMSEFETKPEPKYVIEAMPIFDDREYNDAKKQYRLFKFVQKRLPKKDAVLASEMSISFRKSIKACKNEIRGLLNVRLLKVTKTTFTYDVLDSTKMFEKFVSDLEKHIKKYEKKTKKK